MSDDISDGAKAIVFAVFIIGLIICVTVFGCTDEPTARRVLKESGYRDVYITGFEPVGCGRGDWFATGFSATSQSGDHVTGVVCSGLVTKYSTVRLQ